MPVGRFQLPCLSGLVLGDMAILAGGAIFAVLMASILMSGWPEGLVPNLTIPYSYRGDALSMAWLTQRAIEGWVFENDRSGFPFDSSFLDYPGADSGSILVLKLLGMATGSGAGAMNLYYLLSFPVNFASAYIVVRSLGVGRPLAFMVAMLFAFVPFHFLRLEHLFYTWYFLAPAYVYIGMQVVFGGRELAFSDASWPKRIALALGYMVLACFGVYFTAFGMLVIATAVAYAILHRNKASVRSIAAPALFFLLLGTAANLAPNVIHQRLQGANPEAAARSPGESELYALKPLQLVLPRPDHRAARLSRITAQYNSSTPLVNENASSSMGLLASLGLALLALSAFSAMAGRPPDVRFTVLALFSAILFLFMIVGGLGSLFAHVVSPSIRAWNRASIFVAFMSLAALGMALQRMALWLEGRSHLRFAPMTAWGLIAFGIWDQTVSPCRDCIAATERAYMQDQTFISAMERKLPAGAAVYQLPYMAFPEVPPLHELQAYDHAIGFIHSRSIRWSYAGMKGRPGDLRFRALAQRPAAEQLGEIRRLGFQGVYLDLRGYADGGNEAVAAWTAAIGHEPSLRREDGKIVFFNLNQG